MIKFENFKQETEDRIGFDIHGITIAESNAIRRSLERHIPVMQIADPISHMHFNSMCRQTVRQAFICGLRQVPFLVDPNFFDTLDAGSNAVLDEHNSLKFRLCQNYPHPVDEQGNKIKYDTASCPSKRVLSSSICWIPHSKEQHERLVEHHLEYFKDTHYSINSLCKPAYDDIMLAVLDPGECVDVTFYLTAGTKAGQDYAGFSTVNVASAPSIPVVKLLKPITDIEDAEYLLKLCPQNVFSLNHNSANLNDATNGLISVTNMKDCSDCRQCLRTQKEFSKNIELSELPTSFHFTVESHGSIPVNKLIEEACDAMIQKSKEMLLQIPGKSK